MNENQNQPQNQPQNQYQNQPQYQYPPQQAAKPPVAAPLILGFIGFLLGIPLSYFFQPGLIRAKFTCGEYITNLPQLLEGILKNPDDLGIQILLTLVITCAVTSIIFAVIGHAIAKR